MTSSTEITQYDAIIKRMMFERNSKPQRSSSKLQHMKERKVRNKKRKRTSTFKLKPKSSTDRSRTRSRSSKSPSLFQKIQANHARQTKQTDVRRTNLFHFQKSPGVNSVSALSTEDAPTPKAKTPIMLMKTRDISINGKRVFPEDSSGEAELKEQSTKTTSKRISLYTFGDVVDSSESSVTAPSNQESLEDVNAKYESIKAERDRIQKRITEKKKALFANEEEKVSEPDAEESNVSKPFDYIPEKQDSVQISDLSDNETNKMKNEKFGVQHEIIGELKAKIDRLSDKLIEKETVIIEKNEDIQRLSIQIRESEVKQNAIDTFKRKSVDMHVKLQTDLEAKEYEIECLQQQLRQAQHQSDLIEERDIIIENLQDSFKDVHEKNKNLKLKLKEKEITIQSEEFALSVKNKMIQEVEEEFDELDITLVNMNHKNELLKEKIEDYRESLVEHVQQNEELRHSNEDFVAKYAEMDDELKRRKHIIESKDGMLKMKNKLIDELEKDIEEMEERIIGLTADNKHLAKQIDSEKERQKEDRMHLDVIEQKLVNSTKYAKELKKALDEKEKMVNNLCEKSRRDSKKMDHKETRLSALERSSTINEQKRKMEIFDLKELQKGQAQIIADLKKKVHAKQDEMKKMKREIADTNLIMDGLKKQLSKERKSHKKVMTKTNNALKAKIADLTHLNGSQKNEIDKLNAIKEKYEELSKKREEHLNARDAKINDLECEINVLSNRSSKNDEDLHILTVQNEELLIQMNKQMEELKIRQTEIEILRVNEVKYRMKENEIKDIRRKVQKLSQVKQNVNSLQEENAALRQKLKNNECEFLRLKMKINENVLSYEDMKQGSLEIHEGIDMFNEWMAKINRNLVQLRTIKDSNESEKSRKRREKKNDGLVQNLMQETRDLQQEMKRRLIANH